MCIVALLHCAGGRCDREEAGAHSGCTLARAHRPRHSTAALQLSQRLNARTRDAAVNNHSLARISVHSLVHLEQPALSTIVSFQFSLFK